VRADESKEHTRLFFAAGRQPRFFAGRFEDLAADRTLDGADAIGGAVLDLGLSTG
jgi:hypothetical protein